MESFHDLPILQKIYSFYEHTYLTIEKMPKKDKYTIGERLQNSILDMIEQIILAGYSSSKESKVVYLKKAMVKLDLIKMFVRLAYSVKAIPLKKYTDTEEILIEIGKMLGGWIRSLK